MSKKKEYEFKIFLQKVLEIWRSFFVCMSKTHSAYESEKLSKDFEHWTVLSINIYDKLKTNCLRTRDREIPVREIACVPPHLFIQKTFKSVVVAGLMLINFLTCSRTTGSTLLLLHVDRKHQMISVFTFGEIWQRGNNSIRLFCFNFQARQFFTYHSSGFQTVVCKPVVIHRKYADGPQTAGQMVLALLLVSTCYVLLEDS